MRKRSVTLRKVSFDEFQKILPSYLADKSFNLNEEEYAWITRPLVIKTPCLIEEILNSQDVEKLIVKDVGSFRQLYPPFADDEATRRDFLDYLRGYGIEIRFKGLMREARGDSILFRSEEESVLSCSCRIPSNTVGCYNWSGPLPKKRVWAYLPKDRVNRFK
ncbi:MAG: hypothetical protein RL557_650 [archaeon]